MDKSLILDSVLVFIKAVQEDGGDSSVVEGIYSMHKGLGSISSS